MDPKDLAIQTSVFVGGMTAVRKLSNGESPLPAVWASFLLGLFILVGAKVSPQGAKWFCLVLCVTAFLLNGQEIIKIISKVSGIDLTETNPTPSFVNGGMGGHRL